MEGVLERPMGCASEHETCLARLARLRMAGTPTSTTSKLHDGAELERFVSEERQFEQLDLDLDRSTKNNMKL